MRRLWLWMLAWGLMLGFVWAQNTLTPDLQKQFDRAVQLARAGKLKEAEPILRSILHKRPQFVPAHINLGLVYRLQNQYDKAAYHFRTAAKLNPKDPLPLLELTRMALDRGKLDDAEGYLRTLRQRHPNHPEVAVLSGSLAMLRGQWKEAQAEFQKAFRTRPNDFRIVYNLGVIAYQLENFPEAQRYMERTVQLKPDYTTAWKSLGMVYEALNRPADAIRAYTEALKREPDDLPTRLKRARTTCT
jgi:predicted Zn-dependent protease